MKLQKRVTPRRIFHIDPKKFEIVSPDHEINYNKLYEEIDIILIDLYHQIQYHTKVKESLPNTIDLLLSITKPEENYYEWGSNIILEDHKSYSCYEDVLESLKVFIENSSDCFPKFETIILILEEYISLKKYILSFRAYYFECIAFSKDGYSLKRKDKVFFFDNSGNAIFCEVYSHRENGVIAYPEEGEGEGEELMFDELYMEKESIKEAEK